MTDISERALVNDATGIEFRTDGGLSFEGYAAVWNSPSQPLPFIETIAPGAFSRSLANTKDIRLFVNHKADLPLASTLRGTMKLAEDAHGLKVEADLAPTSYAQDLKVLSERGELRGMSFAFKATKGGETWSADRQNRTLTDVKLYEVSIITHGPAYQATSAALRSLADAIDADAEALSAAVDALAEGRALDDEQADLLMRAIARTRPERDAFRAVPVSVFTKVAALREKTATF